MFPRHARRVMINKKIRTVFDAATFLYDKGYKSVVMTVGSDRVREFETLLNKYNGQKGQHGFYNFQSISISSAGARDPDSEGIAGMSASKMRQFASDNDFTSFSQGLSSNMSNKDSKKIFMDVRDGMGLKEESVFKRHVELEPISDIREEFVKGNLFDLGDTVVLKKSDEMGTIVHLGTNYVVVQIDEERTVRKWIDDVQRVEVVENNIPTNLSKAMKSRKRSYK